MKRKHLLTPFFIMVIPLFFLFIPLTTANVRTEPFSAFFPDGSSLGFQNYPYSVLILIRSGNLSSSACAVGLYEGGGWFRFLSNETATLTISHSTGLTVKIGGDNNNDLRVIVSGSSFPIILNDRVNIIWDFAPNIWFPIEFIFGIVGLFSMFGGSLLGVTLIKKGEYGDALRFSSIWVCMGIALVIAWLWF